MVGLLRNLLLMFVTLSSFSPVAFTQFETRSQSQAPYSPLAIAVGDFNHDGRLDIAVAGYGHLIGQGSGVAVFPGNGNGTFGPPTNYVVSSDSEAVSTVVAADINRDGNLDLAVVDYNDRNVTIFLGNGDGTFQPPCSLPPPPILST